MKKPKRRLLPHIVNILAIALIVECFLCALLMVRKNAQDSCLERIEETTTQMAAMFQHAMNERLEKLTVFADILAANNENPQELLQTYMENFCRTQYFSAVCIHRHDGTLASYGDHPHRKDGVSTFEQELAKLPYVSNVFSNGAKPADNYIFQAVPIVRNGETIAVLYGYMSLDIFPDFVASSAYDGKCQLYVVDGSSGNYLMDEHSETLGNLYDSSIAQRKVKSGYDIAQMRQDIKDGKSGFYIFQDQHTGQWYYTCYMPMGINNWSMQLTIDEATAFASYDTISKTMLVLMAGVFALIIILITSLMLQNASVSKQDKRRLHKASFISAVQRSLLNAHENPDFVDQALKTVAEEMQAETVLLLSLTDKTVRSTQYWPSIDRDRALDMVGRNLRDEFPVLFDYMAANQSILYDQANPAIRISDSAAAFFQSLDIHRIILVPIMDTVGRLKGTLAAVNSPAQKQAEMMESVTYDFSMAITNLENHTIIKNMGAFDYLTGMKNRNSYETELGSLAVLECSSLWCMYVDVNGLREVNNAYGHKAGDSMLCAVAEALKRVLGEKYTYRIGGDEYIAFVTDVSAEEMSKKKKLIKTELAAKGYYVSVGYMGSPCNDDGIFPLEQMIAGAEEIMYREKWEYYQENQIPSDTGHFPFLNKPPQ